MNEVPPATTLRPTARCAYCTGHFPLRLGHRNDPRDDRHQQQQHRDAVEHVESRFLDPAAGTNMSSNACPACGKRAKMPMLMTSEMPLPMPRSVICSPSHISSIVPVVRMITVWMRYHQSVLDTVTSLPC